MTDPTWVQRLEARLARAALGARIVASLWGTRRFLRDRRTRPEDSEFDHVRLVPEYYDRCTDLYRIGWGEQFHFAPFHNERESLAEANTALERQVAGQALILPDHRVLDVGCGIGGPACQIAAATRAQVVALNICRSQLRTARRLARKRGLGDRVSFIGGDAVRQPFSGDVFDAVVTFEALCHVERRETAYRECARVLKPGGRFCGTDWAWTRPPLPSEAELCDDLCRLHSMAPLSTIAEIGEQLERAGFEVLRVDDLAPSSLPDRPWWQPLADRVERPFLRGWGWIDDLVRGGRALVAAGQGGLFTPMCSWVARKPG